MLDRNSPEYKDAFARSRRSLQLSQDFEVVVTRLKVDGFSDDDAVAIATDAKEAIARAYRDKYESWGGTFRCSGVVLLLLTGFIALVEYFSTTAALVLYGTLVLLPFVALFFIVREMSVPPDPNNPADNRPAALEDLMILVLQLVIPFVVICVAWAAFCSRLELLSPGSFHPAGTTFPDWLLFGLDNGLSGIPFDITDVFELQFSTIRASSTLARWAVVLIRALVETYLVVVLIRSIWILSRNGVTLRWRQP